MQDMGNMLLARTAFTTDHYGQVVVGNEFSLLYEFLISPAYSLDDFRFAYIGHPFFQCLLDGFYERNVMDWLLNKFVGTFLHGIHRCRDITVLGHNDKGNPLAVLVDPVEYLNPATVWQAQVA